MWILDIAKFPSIKRNLYLNCQNIHNFREDIFIFGNFLNLNDLEIIYSI